MRVFFYQIHLDKKERQQKILQMLEQDRIVQVSDILRIVPVERTTIYRDFQELEDTHRVEKIGRWSYRKKVDPTVYLQTPFFQRPKKTYNFDFLDGYTPNQSRFFSEKQSQILHKGIEMLDINTDFYTNNKRLLETTLIDLSFASSYLEGNTYDYLDTEILVKYNEIAKEKSADDTQMILNHKKCIEYLVYYKKELLYTKQTFFEIHTLLWERLLPKENLGIIRNKIVEIGVSTYTPLDNRFQLEEQFEIFLEKLNSIQNPFEQSLFILVFIPYFQIFLDINKRTSRMISNLPLLKKNLPLISLLAVEKRDYITAILAVYELNNVSLLADIFVSNYLLNMKRYI